LGDGPGSQASGEQSVGHPKSGLRVSDLYTHGFSQRFDHHRCRALRQVSLSVKEAAGTANTESADTGTTDLHLRGDITQSGDHGLESSGFLSFVAL
jgi:hypothetical protein